MEPQGGPGPLRWTLGPVAGAAGSASMQCQVTPTLTLCRAAQCLLRGPQGQRPCEQPTASRQGSPGGLLCWHIDLFSNSPRTRTSCPPISWEAWTGARCVCHHSPYSLFRSHLVSRRKRVSLPPRGTCTACSAFPHRPVHAGNHGTKRGSSECLVGRALVSPPSFPEWPVFQNSARPVSQREALCPAARKCSLGTSPRHSSMAQSPPNL